MSLREQLKNGNSIRAIDDPDKIKCVTALANDPSVAAIKVGLPIILARDLKVIKVLKKKTKKYLILDLKISDIPRISGAIVSHAKKLGCDALIVQGFVGKQVIKECVEMCEESDVMIFVVTGMTHEDSECNLTNSNAEKIARWAKEARAHGIIVPGNKTNYLKQMKKLRNIVQDDLLVIASGVGKQGGDITTCLLSGAHCVIQGQDECKPNSLGQKIYMLKFYLADGIIFIIVGYLAISNYYPKNLSDFMIGASVGLVFLLISKYREL